MFKDSTAPPEESDHAADGARPVRAPRRRKKNRGGQPSTRQVRANRRNAARSTGPKSPAGKAISSRNATRHGILASAVTLPGEQAEEFEAWRQACIAERQPRTAIESILVDKLALIGWRLRRVYPAEVGQIRLQQEAVRTSAAVP